MKITLNPLKKDSKIFITGHRGMVGSNLLKEFQNRGFTNLIYRTRQELDLLQAEEVDKFLAKSKPDVVIIAAAKVGGIYANDTFPAEFIYQNLAIATNLIHFSWKAGVKRLLFLGSSCIYPRLAPQPMPESCLLTSPLEKTNEAYAIAKIAGLKMCEYYRKQYGVIYHSAMPTNLYGIGDNYHPKNSHVLPALIRRFHEAKINNAPTVEVWGTGKAKREFLHSVDLARGLIKLLELAEPPDLVNVGTGEDISIKELAILVKKIVGYEGKMEFDTSKPDGTPCKLMDVSLIKSLGWEAKIPLEEGIKIAYKDFLTNYA